MKNYFWFFILSILLLLACSKKEKAVLLDEGTPAYELAKGISEKVPFFDPDDNNILVSTKYFDLSTGAVVQLIQSNYGNRASQIASLDSTRLKNVLKQNAEQLANKKLMLIAADRSNLSITEAEYDSALTAFYSRYGGEEKFMSNLGTNNIDAEFVKNEIKSDYKIKQYLDKALSEATAVTDQDIEKAYQQDKTATVRHILLMTQGKSEKEKAEIRKKMEDILAQARQGKDFAELAKQYSDDPGSKDKGGLYENFGRGRMVKPFEDAAFSVPEGEISDIVETQFGYHIIKVIERKKETKPMEEVSSAIKNQISQTKEREAYQQHFEKLKEDAQFQMTVF